MFSLHWLFRRDFGFIGGVRWVTPLPSRAVKLTIVMSIVVKHLLTTKSMEKVVTLPTLVASPQRQDGMPAMVSEVTFSRTEYSLDHRATGVLFLITALLDFSILKIMARILWC
jgi:hypothetical protein